MSNLRYYVVSSSHSYISGEKRIKKRGVYQIIMNWVGKFVYCSAVAKTEPGHLQGSGQQERYRA